MKYSEASALLTLAAGRDNRTIAEAAAEVWAEDLGDTRFVDAREAISTHYRESREWIMPADILRIVRKMRSTRLKDIAPVTPPWQLAESPTAENAWRRTFEHAICDGTNRADAIAEANTAFGITVEPEPLAIEASQVAEIQDKMAKVTADLTRRQSLKAQEAAAKAERFRLAKAERDATQATPTKEQRA